MCYRHLLSAFYRIYRLIAMYFCRADTASVLSKRVFPMAKEVKDFREREAVKPLLTPLFVPSCCGEKT